MDYEIACTQKTYQKKPQTKQQTKNTPKIKQKVCQFKFASTRNFGALIS